jgi:hypothetical protein
MRNRSKSRLFLAFALAGAASTCAAHDTWILSTATLPQPGGLLLAELTSGMSFPAPEFPISPDRIDRAYIRLGKSTSPLAAARPGPHSLSLSGTPPGSGWAVLVAELKPKSIELSPKEVDEYLDEIGLLDTIGVEWKRSGGPKKWRESYTKHAKALIRVGSDGDASVFSEPQGMALELTPVSAAASLRKGSSVTVQLLASGKPLSGFPVGAVGEHGGKGVLKNTDGVGRATFSLDRAGPWLFRATRLSRSDRVETDWDSHFTTLTLFVE